MLIDMLLVLIQSFIIPVAFIKYALSMLIYLLSRVPTTTGGSDDTD